MKHLKALLLVPSLLLVGCADDYTPEPNTLGKKIYKDACARCHTAKEGTNNMYWEVDTKNNNHKYVAFKVNGGSISMPKFPNIHGSNMRRLSKFVLEHSLVR